MLLLGGWWLPTPARAQDSIQQWRRWEKAIVSSRDFTLNGGNPYRDLVLRVRFTKRNTTQSFEQDAFWEALSGAPKSFKVRAALPSGTWDWQVVGCTGSTGNPAQNCAVSTSWTPSSGYLMVSTNTSSGIRLYDRGFLTQNSLLSKTYPPQYLSFTELRYGDAVTPFFWAGDTAWTAPPREIAGQTASWSSFLSNRRTKGFTAVLVAPAVSWPLSSPWPALPTATGFSFLQTSGCSGVPIPNGCSKPASTYWQAFDTLIKQANDQDLLVVVAGVVDPIGAESLGSGLYPNQANAEDFARYLAARLAGSHVVYSPGFDTRVDRTTYAGTSMAVVMESVGRGLKLAAPRHLVSNHLGGSSTCPDYRSFTDPLAPWMTFYLFQSGHAAGAGGTVGPACPARLSTESSLVAAMRRAREMPLTLRTYSGPYMPNVNGEGPYDAASYNPTHPVDNRYRARHAGHLSSLSDALGFTYGTYGLVFWHQLSQNLGLLSADDMKLLADRFRNRAGLPSRHSWILNQQSNQDKKMVLASDDSSLVLAYVPGGGANNIQISTSGLSGLSCGSEWTKKWYSAISANPVTGPVTCTVSTGKITVNRPDCIAGTDCDWFLEMTRTGAALSGPSSSLATDEIEVWAEPGPQPGTSAIRFGSRDSSSSTEWSRATVSESRGFHQASPRLARLRPGYLVAWEAEGPDGSLLGVFAQRVIPGGLLVGPQVQVNQYTEHDQGQPAVASDARGNAVVAWSSYGQDGDLGGIFARVLDASLSPLGEELAVNEDWRGHQSRPQVAFDTMGSFVVAWETELAGAVPARISFRRFSPSGPPSGPEISVAIDEEASLRLVDLAVDPLGEITIRWAVRLVSGEHLGVLNQRFDEAGAALGGPERVLP
jgi:hypothetical protein